MAGTAMRKHRNPSSSSHDWLLHSSGKFTTGQSKLFLETTVVPVYLLETCAKHILYRNRDNRKRSKAKAKAKTKTSATNYNYNNNNKNKNSLESNSKKNQTIPAVVNRLSTRTKSNLLRLVRDERSRNEIETQLSILRAATNEEQNMIHRSRWAACVMARNGIGPEEWNSILEANNSGGCDGVGICPNTNCHVLYFKYGGCCSMVCSCCGMRFRHKMLNTEVIQSGNSTRQQQIKLQISELVFCKQLLETAEKIMANSLKVDKKYKQKPSLNNETHEEIIESIRYCDYNNTYNISCHRPLPRVEEESDVLMDAIVENDPRPCFDTVESETSSSFSLLESLDDEFSFSVDTTDTTPSNYTHSVSLCDYIVVSGLEEKEECGDSSPSWNQEVNWEDDEECSYSFLSGCETVYSLNDDDYRTNYSSCVVAKPEAGMVLSYCNAAKLGNSTPKNTSTPPMDRTATGWKEQQNGASYYCSTKSHKNDRFENKRNSKDTSSCSTSNFSSKDYDNCYSYSDDDDLFCSLYDAAKSCHGGRVSSRFRGNNRTMPSWSGWGVYRRPNWTRKRRKEWKTHHQTRKVHRKSLEKPQKLSVFSSSSPIMTSNEAKFWREFLKS